jgi:putative hydrolase of the HAD superfamily
LGKYKAVIFDLGGTLINQSTWDEQSDYVERMAAVLGVEQEGFLRLWRETYDGRTTGTIGNVQDCIDYICRQLKKPAAGSEIETAFNIPLEITRRRLTYPKENAIEVLSTLKKDGYRTGLLSNWSSTLPASWRDSPLAPLIDIVIISCDVKLMKPDPRIFLLAAERLGVRPGDCLYIADGMDGELEGALKVGMYAVKIRFPDDNDTSPYREQWEGPEISSLKEVLAFLKD